MRSNTHAGLGGDVRKPGALRTLIVLTLAFVLTGLLLAESALIQMIGDGEPKMLRVRVESGRLVTTVAGVNLCVFAPQSFAKAAQTFEKTLSALSRVRLGRWMQHPDSETPVESVRRWVTGLVEHALVVLNTFEQRYKMRPR